MQTKNQKPTAFTSDATYKQMTTKYEKKDAFLAFLVYIIVISLLFGLGLLQIKTSISPIYPGLLNLLISVSLIIIVLRFRKQKLDSVGITLKHFIKALIVGLVLGIILSMITIIPAIMSGGKWTGFYPLIWNIPYFLIIIGFQEEFVFRGYIQTRIYGIIKWDVLAIIIGGIMFAFMHVPFQFFIRGYDNILIFFAENGFWLILTFIWHFVFNFLYRKFNSLTAPTICHFLMNLSNTLFK
jgi:membrane protease YdiL (CAAX protease family)